MIFLGIPQHVHHIPLCFSYFLYRLHIELVYQQYLTYLSSSLQKHSSAQIAEITDHLFLSGRGAITTERLKLLGITQVLNVAEEIHNMTYPPDYPLICHFIAMKDNSDEKILNSVDKCFEYICNAKKNNGRILVHCVAGISRSASICIMYMMKYKNLSLLDAYNHVLSCRDSIYPNTGFWRSMIDFELDLRGENSVEMRPYIFGWRPNVNPADLQFLLRGWMDYITAFYMRHILIFLLQILWLCFT